MSHDLSVNQSSLARQLKIVMKAVDGKRLTGKERTELYGLEECLSLINSGLRAGKDVILVDDHQQRGRGR